MKSAGLLSPYTAQRKERLDQIILYVHLKSYAIAAAAAAAVVVVVVAVVIAVVTQITVEINRNKI
jgi:ABC-type sulfate transport system permease component